MNGIHLDFQPFQPAFEGIIGIEGALADTHAPYAAAYMVYLGARSFGMSVEHRHADSSGCVKTEKVEAFSNNQYLYIVRTIGDKSRVYKYFAPYGLLLSEACLIAQEHYRLTTLPLVF
jgi:hypothetical protein